ncbi:MAG: hypothetical protein ACREQM_10830, partial [Candidatus Dormibacteraceae bacterium]
EYLVSCSPQAWGAGALFHFVQTLFGIEADLLRGQLRIDPVRTPLFGSVEVQGMRIADGELDFSILYGEGAPQVAVHRKPAAIKTLQLGPG